MHAVRIRTTHSVLLAAAFLSFASTTPGLAQAQQSTAVFMQDLAGPIDAETSALDGWGAGADRGRQTADETRQITKNLVALTALRVLHSLVRVVHFLAQLLGALPEYSSEIRPDATPEEAPRRCAGLHTVVCGGVAPR